MRMAGHKERLSRVCELFWQWISELPEPLTMIAFWLAVGTVIGLWVLGLLYFIWRALQWVGMA